MHSRDNHLNLSNTGHQTCDYWPVDLSNHVCRLGLQGTRRGNHGNDASVDKRFLLDTQAPPKAKTDTQAPPKAKTDTQAPPCHIGLFY